jgi:hypothetical protein
MKNATTVSTLDSIKETIIERLSDYKGGTYYACDLCFTLFEGENASGSVFCNTYKTKEYIKENFDLFGDFLESYQGETGETLNPFNEPEKCHVIFLIEAANRILCAGSFISANWDNKIELNDENIEAIKCDVEAFTGDIF